MKGTFSFHEFCRDLSILRRSLHDSNWNVDSSSECEDDEGKEVVDVDIAFLPIQPQLGLWLEVKECEDGEGGEAADDGASPLLIQPQRSRRSRDRDHRMSLRRAGIGTSLRKSIAALPEVIQLTNTEAWKDWA